MNNKKEFEVELDLKESKAYLIDNESESAYVSYKERHDPSTTYIDEKRKSFPIRKGHECTDLAAAVNAWGRYKGSMTHDQFVSKVKGLMKKHSCPVPKAWQK